MRCSYEAGRVVLIPEHRDKSFRAELVSLGMPDLLGIQCPRAEQGFDTPEPFIALDRKLKRLAIQDIVSRVEECDDLV